MPYIFSEFLSEIDAISIIIYTITFLTCYKIQLTYQASSEFLNKFQHALSYVLKMVLTSEHAKDTYIKHTEIDSFEWIEKPHWAYVKLYKNSSPSINEA